MLNRVGEGRLYHIGGGGATKASYRCTVASSFGKGALFVKSNPRILVYSNPQILPQFNLISSSLPSKNRYSVRW